MDEGFDPVQAGAVAVQEPPTFDPVASGAVPVEQPATVGQIVRHAGEAAYNVAKGFVTGLPQMAVETLFPEKTGLQEIGRAARTLGEVIHGTPVSEAAKKEYPESQTLVEAEKTPAFSRERFEAGFGTIAQLGMLALGTRGAKASLSDVAFGKPEVPTEAPLTEAAAVEPTVAAQPEVPPQPIESQVAANNELAPLTEPPSAIAEPFPSLLRSAEDQRRAELQQPAPQVREAISLDELRLMRERNDLRLQNDISQRTTGATHPVVDERLGQIDNELTKIANRELQTKGGGEVIAKSISEDEARYGQGVRQEEGGDRSGKNVEQTPQGNRPDSGAGPEVAPTVPQPEQPIVPTVETAPEPVRPPEITSLTRDSLPNEVGPNVNGFDTTYGPGEIKSGDTVNPDDLFRQGKADLASGKDPYALAARARTGDVSPRELGLLAAEHDRLLTEAANSEGKPDYPEKYQQAKDFAQNMLKPAGTKFHQLGMGLQIKAPVDFSNLTGFRQAFEERFNKEMTTAQAETFNKMSRDIATAKAEDSAELGRTADRVQQRFKSVKDISFEDAVKGLNDAIAKALKDCNL